MPPAADWEDMGPRELPALQRFCGRLEVMGADDLHAVAAGLEVRGATAAGEVETWRAILEIDRELRRQRRTRDAARAAHRAATCVLGAAEHERIPLPDPEVTRVARAAADIARGILVDDALAADVRACLAAWQSTFGSSPAPVRG